MTSHMVYTKNPNYWDADNVKIEKLEFMLSADDTAIYAAYNAGDLDFIDTVPTDEIATLRDNPEFYIIDQPGHLLRRIQRASPRCSTARPLEQAVDHAAEAFCAC